MVLRIVTARYDSNFVDLEVSLLEQMSRNVGPANAEIISVVLGIDGQRAEYSLRTFVRG